MDNKELIDLLASYFPPFYLDLGFWLGMAVGVASMIFSILAFLEAKAAKSASYEAGKTVKIQTITIELTELVQRLDTLNYELNFQDARNLLNEVNRRLRRLIAPFQASEEFSVISSELKNALNEAKSALEGVRPPDGDDVPLNSVYFAMQGHFYNVSALVAELMGLFEKRTIEVVQK